MAKTKKKRTKPQKKQSRMDRAKQWLPLYEGTKIVRAYRKKFYVDTRCAVNELQELGYEFKLGYAENLLKAEAARLEQLRIKKEEKRLAEIYDNDTQNDMFYFIAGYTSGGAPYGVTWDEMGLEPYEEEFDDEEIIHLRDYDSLNKRQKETADNRLREAFSEFVNSYGYLPDRSEQRKIVENIFENFTGGPLYYYDSFIKTFRKIIKKRYNRFIREGIMPRSAKTTEPKETDDFIGLNQP